MRNILLVIALVFSFGISQSYAQKKSVSEVEKIVIREMSKKETIKNPKYIKTREGKKANKLVVKKDIGTRGKIIVAPRPPRPPKPPTPPCICHPISLIDNGFNIGQLLNIYPNATVVLIDQNKKMKEFKLSSSNSSISKKEFDSLKGDVTIIIQLLNKKNKDNPTPIEMTLQR